MQRLDHGVVKGICGMVKMVAEELFRPLASQKMSILFGKDCDSRLSEAVQDLKLSLHLTNDAIRKRAQLGYGC